MIANIKGNISTIHWYTRTRITEETRPKYGKIMGIGTGITGMGLIIAVLMKIILVHFVSMSIVESASGIIVLLFAGVGILLMIYAQFKYNKGIF